MQAPAAAGGSGRPHAQSPIRAAKRARRVHCVPLPVTPLRLGGDAAAATAGGEQSRVARLVRRKQQAKRANAGRCRPERSPVPPLDGALLKVFEFQPSAPDAEETASSPMATQKSHPERSDEELESCARHLQQLKWWIQHRVREKLLRAQRKVHRSLDMQSLSPLDAR